MTKHALIVNHNAGSPYHGPNFRSYYAARGWVKNGMKVTIVCSAFSHKLKTLPKVEGNYAIEEIDGIRYIWLKTKPFSGNIGRLLNYLEFNNQLKIIKNIVKEPVDYVVCSSPPPFWFWFCKRFALLKNASLIFEARDLWPDVIFETTRLGLFNPVAWGMKLAELSAYKHSSCVVSVNESAIKIMKTRGLPPAKFFAIPNGTSIDTKKSSASLSKPEILCNELKKEGFFIIGYSGALSKVYGLSFLVEAAKYLKNEKIAFVLAGIGDYEIELKKLAEQLPNVHLVGWIKKGQLIDFLGSVDICYAGLLDVRSFSYGSDSTKIYEYMKASKPILHAISNRESVVVKAKCGIRVAPENSNALAKGIKKLSALKSEALMTMGNNGMDYLIKNRSYDILTQKWMNLFNILDKKRGMNGI